MKIYGLIDPRTNLICYIGYTIQELKKRLTQHNNPKSTNMSKIAKLKRSLGAAKFDIIELFNCNSMDEMYLKEIELIAKYKADGYKLYNLQEGGLVGRNPKESIKAMLSSREKNKDNHIVVRGEACSFSKSTEIEILYIYQLIKSFHSDGEINKLLDNRYKKTGINMIRRGSNWKHLWYKHFTEVIPSIKTEKSKGYSPRVKLSIVELLDNGCSIEDMLKVFPRINKFDFKRIQRKELWKPVWEVYNKFKAPYISNSICKPFEFSGSPVMDNTEPSLEIERCNDYPEMEYTTS